MFVGLSNVRSKADIGTYATTVDNYIISLNNGTISNLTSGPTKLQALTNAFTTYSNFINVDNVTALNN